MLQQYGICQLFLLLKITDMDFLHLVLNSLIEKFSDKGIGYGMDAYTIDGNNIIEVYRKVLEKKIC